MVFGSKVDSWLIGILLLTALIAALAVPSLLRQPMTASSLVTLLVTVVLGLGLPLWLIASTRYVIEEGVCTIRSGPFRWRVPLDSVESVTPTRNPISSPALSLDRLEIRYAGGKRVLVSPKRRDEFIAALQMQKP